MCGVRERDRADVVAVDVDGDGHAPAAGDQRLVGVAHALGVGRAPGRVVDPADRGLVGGEPGRRRRQRRGVALGEPVVDDDDAWRRVEVRGHPLGQLAEVEAAELAGDREELRAGLAQREADLALAVEVDDRVLERAEPAERRRQHHRVDARRQLPRERRGLVHPHRLQAGGHPLGPVAELPEGQGPVVLVDEHREVRVELGAALDELPDRARPGDDLFPIRRLAAPGSLAGRSLGIFAHGTGTLRAAPGQVRSEPLEERAPLGLELRVGR